MRKIISLSAVAILMMGCVSHDVDDFRNENPANDAAKANDFNFSTVNDVALTVDYSACKPSTPVFFRIYNENPFEGDELNKKIKPIYSNFTDANGRFSRTIELPSYASDLYIFTGDFFIDEQLMNAKVTDNRAIAIANSSQPSAARRRVSQGSGVLTDDLTNLYQLSYEVDFMTGDNTGNQIYNNWKTWLGKWDSRTGRPNYLVKSNDPNYAALTFDDEDMTGIRQSIAAAVVRKQDCPLEFRQSADLTLKESAAVSVTFIGSNTCWNNCLGYYYYQGEAPTSLKDIHVVMLFPNTQDGHSQFVNQKHGSKYYGNIALERGDAVELIYYPRIAEGSEEGATTIFPAGMKIGFLLKSNGWGMQKSHDGINYYNGYKGAVKNSSVARQYNCWSASTDGLSYCPENEAQSAYDEGCLLNPNPSGESRTAKFAYEKDGQQYAIVAFEDAANDQDYGDVILALKPIGVFQELPVPTSQTSTTNDVFAYEDLWPSAGDYDMNDAVVDVKEDRVWSMFKYKNTAFITKQIFKFTTDQNYVTKASGLAVTLETKNDGQPTSIEMKKILPGSEEPVAANFTKDGNVYLLTGDITRELHTTYILELTFEGGITEGNAAKIKPFIYRNVADSKRWEVHIPMEAPTAKMDVSFFGKDSDRSDISQKKYYVGEGDYPFAFRLAGVGIDVFKNTILKRDNESKAIDVFFPEFIEWSTSNGKKKKDWYLHPVAE
jgi:LruC domain-containing protein